jgi:hypothetical protein
VDTRTKVEQLSVQIEENKAKAAKFQKECEDYLVVLVSQKREADEQAKVSFFLFLNLKTDDNIKKFALSHSSLWRRFK